MGKLLDKMRQVGQAGGGGFGFFSRGQASSAPARPAAVVLTLAANEVAAAEAAAKAGVDAIILTGWKPGADVSAIKSALESASVLWGVEYSSGGGAEDVVAAAQKAGASFLCLGENAPASPLYEQPEQFDRVVALTAPVSEMDMLMYRMASALPAQVGIVTLPVGMRDLPQQTVAQFTRLAVLAASVRFPLLAAVDETPDLRASRTLVRLGFDGIVLSGVGVTAERIAQAVQTVRADLEKIPLSEAHEHEGVSLGGLVGNLGASVQPERPAPEKEPEHE